MKKIAVVATNLRDLAAQYLPKGGFATQEAAQAAADAAAQLAGVPASSITVESLNETGEDPTWDMYATHTGEIFTNHYPHQFAKDFGDFVNLVKQFPSR